jgi:sugar/nucleoside kinase (ribokinase family)
MDKSEVLIIGRSCVDHLAIIDQFPAEDQKAPLSAKTIEGGGQGGTAACCIARLGGKVVYVGKLGDDAEGRFCRERLETFGVDTRCVATVPGGCTPVAYIMVTPGGKRTIIYEHNALPPIEIDARLRRLIDQTQVILLDPETTYLAPALQKNEQSSYRIVYDAERPRPGIEAMMQVADDFIPPISFLDIDYEPAKLPVGAVAMLDQFRRRLKGRLIVTMGAYGALYFDRQRLYRVPAAAVEVVDTTGAGDNFHAAFALAMARDYQLDEAVKLAVAVASLSCRGLGGRLGLPTWEEAIQQAANLKPQLVAEI